MISAIFKTFLLSLCIVANTHLAYAQTASILPPAKTQFLDNNGKPLTSGTVDFYIPSTTTRKTTWQNSAETIANANPVVLDAGGRAIIYGDGSYRQVVKDRLGNIIWDQLTSSTGSGGGSTPTATGDGDLVGTIKPWAGMTAPNQYAFTYGQEVNRITYATLFTAMTSTQAAFCTSASPTISGLTDTTNFWIGMSVELTCVAAGFSTIVSKTSTTVTLAANANVTTNLNATFFPWGRGNGSTTFNLPDFRGLIPTGNNIMGGVASSNLNTTYFGAATPNATGAPGGSQSMQLVEANIPSITSTGNNSISVSSVQGAIPSNTSSAGTVEALSGSRFGVLGGSSGTVAPVINSAITSTNASQSIVVTTSGTLSTAFSLVQPSKTVNYIIKTTPDSNSATASGVTSLGLMTGDIACGGGLLCTGNIISVTGIGLTVGASPITSGTTTRVLYDNAGILGEYSISGTGNVAMTTSPVFVTPSLGTPSSGVATNLTGLPLTTGVTGILPLANGGTNANLTASNGGIFWSNATQAQILAGTATARLPLLSGSSATPVWGTYTIPASVTSGGVPYFSSTSAMTSSALLTANAFMIGGGAGAAPTTVAITGLVLGNGASAPTAYGGVTCTNQFLRVLSAAGAGTCATVSLTADVTGTLLIANGGSSQTTALAARGSSGFNIDQATSTGDADYTILSTDRMVYHTALSAARTDTLPAANAVNAGQQFVINDFRGVASGVNTITLQRAGADTINGSTSVVAISAQYGAGIFWSDGSSRWTFQPISSGGGGGTVTQITPGSGLVSATTASCSQTAITTSGTLYAAECLNAQTGTSYAIVDGDRAKLVTASNAAAQAYTIAQAGAASNFQSGWFVDIKNISTNAAGIVTITPTTSTINGAATYTLRQGNTARIVSDGTNYQVTLTGVPSTTPTVQTFLSGSGTYTTAAGVKWIRVRLIGGGGGGSGSGTGSPTAGGAGGNSTFNTTSCAGNGGSGGDPSSDVAGAGGSASGGSVLNLTGGRGGGASAVAQSGGVGGSGYYGGAGTGGRPGAADPGTAGATNTGGGGGGGTTATNVEAGGGSGGYCETIISTPAASYAYAVGAAGTAGGAGTGGAAGGAGGSGQVVVEEHYN